MLQLGSRGPRAIIPCYICTSCTAAAVRSRVSSPAPRLSSKCFASKSKSSSSAPHNRRKPRKVRSKSASTRTSQEHLKLWRETLDVLKEIKGTKSPEGEATSFKRQPLSEHVEAKDAKAAGGDLSSKGNEEEARPDSSPEPQKAKKQIDFVQSSLKQHTTEDSRGKLIDGALAVLNNILTSHAESQGLSEETGSKEASETSDKDTRKTVKKKPKKVSTASTAGSEKQNEPTPATAQSQSWALQKGPAEKIVPGTKALKSAVKATTKKQLEMKKALGEKKERQTVLGPIAIETVNAHQLHLTPIDIPQPPVPKLEYGLDRVLFNPGVYHLQDPRSRVYNFDPYLASIMPIHQFDFNALKQYVTSSKDKSLISIAAQHKKKYCGSTSSMTAMLAHFHYLVSSWRPINPAHTSRSFNPDSLNFTRIMRAPAAAFLHWKDGTYAIDADKEFDSANVLSMLGKSMEKLLTLPKNDYEKYRRVNSDQLTEEQRNADDSFHYTTMGDFMMRSQLDAHDKRLPGSGMFDLKTRAVVSIRMDARDFHKGVGYEIRRRFGQWESYEREYFDMIRSAFLKYSLQVRMGRMDGIFVAFHNTQRIFGFQYISVNEMDLALHGTDNRSLGDREYKISLKLLNNVLDKATAKFPGRSLRLHIETRPAETPFMYIFAKPVVAEEIEAVQTANKESIEKFENELLGLKSEERVIEDDEDLDDEDLEDDRDDLNEGKYSELAEQDNEEVWQNMRAVVQETMENEVSGLETIRDAIQDALTHSGLLRTRSSEEARHYIDALLEALSPGARAEQTAAEILPSREAEDLLDSHNDQGGFEGYDVPRGRESGDLASTRFVDGKDSEITPEADASTEEHPGPSVEVQKGKSVDMASLKDLIVSLATKLETGPLQESQDAQIDGASTDQAKLQKFGRILSEMIVKSKDSGEIADEAKSPEKSEHENASKSPSVTTDAAARTQAEESPFSKLESRPLRDDEEILGMILTVRNKVNGHYVKRPEDLTKKDSWVVAYHLEEIPNKRAKTIYEQIKKRRQTALSFKEDRNDEWSKMFRGSLRSYSNKGKKFRQREIELAKSRPVYVYGHDEPLDYKTIFEQQGE